MGDIHLCNSGKGSIINKNNFPSFSRPGGAVLLALQDMVLPGGRPHELLRHGRPEEGAGVPGQQAGGRGHGPRDGGRQIRQVFQMCVPQKHLVLRPVCLL